MARLRRQGRTEMKEPVSAESDKTRGVTSSVPMGNTMRMYIEDLKREKQSESLCKKYIFDIVTMRILEKPL